MKSQKLFIGRKIKQIRTSAKLTQSAFAKTLDISTSYLNLIENNQRHVTAGILIALAEQYQVDIASLSDNEADRLLANLIEATRDSNFDTTRPSRNELRHVAINAPDFAKSFLAIHQSHKHLGQQMVEMDSAMVRGGAISTPYEEVRDFFHFQDNYIHALDRAGEALAGNFDPSQGRLLDFLIAHLKTQHNIKTIFETTPPTDHVLWSFEAKTKQLTLNTDSGAQTHCFQIAHHIARLEQNKTIHAIIKAAKFRSSAASKICQIGLANYFAGSIVLPYEKFHTAAKQYRHDLIYLSDRFDVSIEQVCHRLSTLQRPARKGVPFFFARVDQAGNITKRHSATKLQFARFGAACPLWNVHAAFETPDRIIKQLAETPEGDQYICIAKAISKQSGRYGTPVRRYALALGCETIYADQIVYCDGLDIHNTKTYERIGVSCRICDRKDCHQRSLPPLNRDLNIDPNKRDIVPYGFE